LAGLGLRGKGKKENRGGGLSLSLVRRKLAGVAIGHVECPYKDDRKERRGRKREQPSTPSRKEKKKRELSYLHCREEGEEGGRRKKE